MNDRISDGRKEGRRASNRIGELLDDREDRQEDCDCCAILLYRAALFTDLVEAICAVEGNLVTAFRKVLMIVLYTESSVTSKSSQNVNKGKTCKEKNVEGEM